MIDEVKPPTELNKYAVAQSAARCSRLLVIGGRRLIIISSLNLSPEKESVAEASPEYATSNISERMLPTIE
jgi:hypothetical protein